MIQPELKTDRILLRTFNIADSREVQRLAGNFNVSRMTMNIPYPYELGMAEKWISAQEENWNTKTRVSYAIVELSSNKLLGAMCLVSIEGVEGELGYWIGEPYWSMGYCTEAAKELVRFSFESLGLERIVAQHLTVNPASGKVLEKIGMDHVQTTQMPDRYGKSASMEIYEIRKTSQAHAEDSQPPAVSV